MEWWAWRVCREFRVIRVLNGSKKSTIESFDSVSREASRMIVGKRSVCVSQRNRGERLLKVLSTGDDKHGLLKSIVHTLEETTMKSLKFILKPIERIDVGECKGCVQRVSRHVVVLLHDIVSGIGRLAEVLQLGQVREIAEHEHVAGVSLPVYIVSDGTEGVLQGIEAFSILGGNLLGNFDQDCGPTIAAVRAPYSKKRQAFWM